jgi:hypothetical protein
MILKKILNYDILYLNTPINSKSLERPILPKMIILSELISDSILDYNMLEQEDDNAQEIIAYLINYITQRGKPNYVT